MPIILYLSMARTRRFLVFAFVSVSCAIFRSFEFQSGSANSLFDCFVILRSLLLCKLNCYLSISFYISLLFIRTGLYEFISLIQ